LGRDKVDSKLRKLSLYIELGNFGKASELLSELSELIPLCSVEDGEKILKFLNFYSEKLKLLEKKFSVEAEVKMKVKKSYLR